jgi:ATP adenylyltransferase
VLQQAAIRPQRLLDLDHPLDIQRFVQVCFQFDLCERGPMHDRQCTILRASPKGVDAVFRGAIQRADDDSTAYDSQPVLQMTDEMMSDFSPGTLWERVVATSRRALRAGALMPIPTSFEFIPDGGIRFLVRVVARLNDKPRREGAANACVSPPANPFLPYDHELLVAEAGPRHVCLLNKFNVVNHHLLIVTRDFIHQDHPLDVFDFAVWWRCLAEYPALGFYNGGALAGASQPHRHLQLVPLPLVDSGLAIPIEPLLASETGPQYHPASPQAPFGHALVRFDSIAAEAGDAMPGCLHQLYCQLLDLTRIAASRLPDGRLQSAYNLLLTRQWMMLVPRRLECFDGISLNALAFAGAFLVRDQRELAALRDSGPMTALSHVAM